MPAQPKVGEPLVAGVAEWYLEYGIVGDVEQPRRFAGSLHDERQHVEAGAGPARPAEVKQRAGEGGRLGSGRWPDGLSEGASKPLGCGHPVGLGCP